MTRDLWKCFSFTDPLGTCDYIVFIDKENLRDLMSLRGHMVCNDRTGICIFDQTSQPPNTLPLHFAAPLIGNPTNLWNYMKTNEYMFPFVFNSTVDIKVFLQSLLCVLVMTKISFKNPFTRQIWVHSFCYPPFEFFKNNCERKSQYYSSSMNLRKSSEVNSTYVFMEDLNLVPSIHAGQLVTTCKLQHPSNLVPLTLQSSCTHVHMYTQTHTYVKIKTRN